MVFDLLTLDEARDRANVFDIALLARRMVDVTGWLAGQPDTASGPVGYFVASTGAGRRWLRHASRCQGSGGDIPRRAA